MWPFMFSEFFQNLKTLGKKYVIIAVKPSFENSEQRLIPAKKSDKRWAFDIK